MYLCIRISIRINCIYVLILTTNLQKKHTESTSTNCIFINFNNKQLTMETNLFKIKYLLQLPSALLIMRHFIMPALSSPRGINPNRNIFNERRNFLKKVIPNKNKKYKMRYFFYVYSRCLRSSSTSLWELGFCVPDLAY